MITAEGLTKRYGAALAVDGLTVEVRPGRVTGFLGSNGAGKTTTLRMVLGLAAPTAGRALVDGRPYRELRRPLHRVGALLDATALAGGRTGRQHLAVLARSNGVGPARVAAVLAEVGLDAAADRRIGGWSLGMKQRLGIAAALLGDPGVLLFDEPANGLDPEGIRWLRTLLRRLAAEGRTVLVSSHLMAEMEHTADHLVVIGRGRLIADAPLTELTALGTARTVTVRSPRRTALEQALTAAGGRTGGGPGDTLEVTGLTVARIGELALEHRIPVHELTAGPGALEEVFLRLTEEKEPLR